MIDIVNGKIDVSFLETKNKNLHDFLNKFFCKDVDKRPNAKEILDHPFIKSNEPTVDDIITIIETGENESLKELLRHFSLSEAQFEVGKHPLDAAVPSKSLDSLKIQLENGDADVSKGKGMLATQGRKG